MKPAPHIRPDGTVTRPIGTLGEMLRRAVEPEPAMLSWRQRSVFLATLRNCPQFRRDVLAALGWREH